MKQWKKAVNYTLVLALCLTCLTAGVSYAATSGDLNEVNKKITQTQKELNQQKAASNQLKKQINQIESNINQTQKDMESIQANINKTVNEIVQVESNLSKLQEEMTQQNESMNQRLRAMYMNGNTGTMEVLLGSSSITELMHNLDFIQRIYDNDADILAALQAQHNEVAAQKKQLESLKATLKQQQEQEAAKQASLKSSKDQLASQKQQTDAEIKETSADLDTFKKEADALVAQIRAASTNNASFGGGALGWPVSGSRITSNFGYRTHPISGKKKLHTGVDLAVPTGTQVHAAGDGVVIISKYNSSYGYYVVIDHGKLADGTKLTTLYAHNSKLAVSVGQSVSRGTVIAYSGSTGDSTGPHCHFEVRVNGNYQNPLSWL